MLRIVICVGSSCHVRGADEVAGILECLIEEQHLADKVELIGAFCMDHCSIGVTVRVGDRVYSGICPEQAKDFFGREILPRLRPGAVG